MNVSEPRLTSGGPKLIREDDRYHSHGINLNHNSLHGRLETLPNFVRMTIFDPQALATLDLSFNIFSEIPAVGGQCVEEGHTAQSVLVAGDRSVPVVEVLLLP